MSYYSRNPHFNTSDIDVDQQDADERAEAHDEYLHKLVRDEYNAAVRFAKGTFEHEHRAAMDLPVVEYAAAFTAADRKFTAAIQEARAAMPARLAKLRANDVEAV